MKKNIHRSLVKAALVKAVPVMTGVDARPCPRCPLSSNP